MHPTNNIRLSILYSWACFVRSSLPGPYYNLVDVLIRLVDFDENMCPRDSSDESYRIARGINDSIWRWGVDPDHYALGRVCDFLDDHLNPYGAHQSFW
jgi:hypothetical protein